ncbi:MAG: fumarate hydratase [Erysipelotrichales bacterium]|nr:fumarate hydratase [Erysipelotrichales bacterium]
MTKNEMVERIKDTLVRAGSTFSEDKFCSYEQHISSETNELGTWMLETIRDNAVVAKKNRSPLCDDTGIPHVVLEIGRNRAITGELMEAIYEGIAAGLNELPGRPMAILGDERQRIDQSLGLNPDSAALLPGPFSVRYRTDEPEMLRLHILMQGGGPEIRAKTYRVFHRHNMDVVMNEIISWAKESVAQLGCSPCTLAVGIGRSHYEASSLMLQAMIDGNYNVQSEYEKKITDAVNESNVGPLGLGGKTSVLATFMKIGEQRASGVRIVCMWPCCCFEPRKAYTDL